MRFRLRLRAWPPVAALALAGAALLATGSQTRADQHAVLYEGLSAADRALAEENLQAALETHESQARISWRRADGSWGGTVMPVRTFRIESGIYCREFIEDIILPGAARSATFTACRDTGGTWITVE